MIRVVCEVEKLAGLPYGLLANIISPQESVAYLGAAEGCVGKVQRIRK